ncbi:MAG: DCC1-like thiol-disulfide oxidoreductase family protein [Candidatus Kapabacteria bacterium]|nr:DCC1-like thiol-disulfide oxidoreductase family protein [Candidatus Kapabacteria bacterium]MDW8011818.1 DCC1-like thiol-disulfide oxidoreductase family protein [Bacteroidota bacterium]
MERTGDAEGLTLRIDSACSFCSGLGQWIHRRAARRGLPLRVMPLPEGSDAVVVEYGGQRFEAAEALSVLLQYLGGGFRVWAWLLRVLPPPFRNACYRWVAQHRYRLFGRTSHTRGACSHGSLE